MRRPLSQCTAYVGLPALALLLSACTGSGVQFDEAHADMAKSDQGLAFDDKDLAGLPADDAGSAEDLAVPVPPRWRFGQVDVGYNDVWGSGAKEVWVAGYDLQRTVDGGRTFVASASPVPHGADSVWAPAPGEVYVAGSGVAGFLAHSTNGGRDWAKAPLGGDVMAMFRVRGARDSVYAVGVAVGGSLLVASADRGKTWSTLSLPNVHPQGVWAHPTRVGALWVCGKWTGSVILYSSDGGKSWLDQSPGDKRELFNLFGVSGSELYAVGERGAIFHTSDGMTWTAQDSGTTANLRAVWASGPTDVFVAGQNLLLHSTDHGVHWEPVPLPLPNGTDTTYYGLWGSGPEDVYLLGEGLGGMRPSLLLHYN